jgi:hypothetical protein
MRLLRPTALEFAKKQENTGEMYQILAVFVRRSQARADIPLIQ